MVLPDPLTDTADPGRYVSRAETESVLARLEAALEEGVRFVVLSGPPGLGKTLLLHVLEERQREERRLIFSPFLHFPPSEAGDWLRGLLLDNGLEGDDDRDWRETLSAVASERPLLLIVDEAQSMPPATAARLANGLRRVRTGMSAVLAGIEGPQLDRVVMALGEPVVRVRLETPLTPAEARDLIERSIRERADEPMGSPAPAHTDARALHAAAEGNPRTLKALMFGMVLGKPLPAPAPEPVGSSSITFVRNGGEPDREESTVFAVSTSSVDSSADDAVSDSASLGVEGRARLEAARIALAIRFRALALRTARYLDASKRWLTSTGQRATASGSAGIGRLRGFVSSAAAAGRGAISRAAAAARPSLRDAFADLRGHVAAGARGAQRLVSNSIRLGARGWRLAREKSSHLGEPSRVVELLVVAASCAIGIVVAHLVLREAPLLGPDPPMPIQVAARPSVSAPPPAASEPVLSAREDGSVPLATRPANRADEADGEARERALLSVAAAPSGVTLYVNARPWAHIRIEGEEIGVTPLNRPDTPPGRYHVEATFPDGRSVTRVVEVGPDSQFVTFP